MPRAGLTCEPVTGGAQEGEKGEEGGGLFTKALKSPGRTLEGPLYTLFYVLFSLLE